MYQQKRHVSFFLDIRYFSKEASLTIQKTGGHRNHRRHLSCLVVPHGKKALFYIISCGQPSLDIDTNMFDPMDSHIMCMYLMTSFEISEQ